MNFVDKREIFPYCIPNDKQARLAQMELTIGKDRIKNARLIATHKVYTELKNELPLPDRFVEARNKIRELHRLGSKELKAQDKEKELVWLKKKTHEDIMSYYNFESKIATLAKELLSK